MMIRFNAAETAPGIKSNINSSAALRSRGPAAGEDDTTADVVRQRREQGDLVDAPDALLQVCSTLDSPVRYRTYWSLRHFNGRLQIADESYCAWLSVKLKVSQKPGEGKKCLKRQR